MLTTTLNCRYPIRANVQIVRSTTCPSNPSSQSCASSTQKPLPLLLSCWHVQCLLGCICAQSSGMDVQCAPAHNFLAHPANQRHGQRRQHPLTTASQPHISANNTSARTECNQRHSCLYNTCMQPTACPPTKPDAWVSSVPAISHRPPPHSTFLSSQNPGFSSSTDLAFSALVTATTRALSPLKAASRTSPNALQA